MLNTAGPVEFAVDLVPGEHVEHKLYLRLRKLPVNELANTVLVVKLEFDRLTEASPPQTGPSDKADIMRR